METVLSFMVAKCIVVSCNLSFRDSRISCNLFALDWKMY